MSWIDGFTGSGPMNPVVDSPWGVLVTLALGLAVGYWLGNRKVK